MKKIAVVFNGGTISMKVDKKVKAAVPGLSSEEIMAGVTGIESFAEVEMHTFSSLPSPSITPELMVELARLVEGLAEREDIDGVVVTHGTDTLEETSYMLDLLLKTKKPVVVTGAMRNSSELGYDGPANLAGSICVASSDEARGKGVLVCLNNEVNSANEVTKEHSMHLNTFKSPEFGPVGIVDGNEVIFYRENLKREDINTDKIEERVSLIKSVAGDDGSLIDYCVQKGDKGIVVEAMGRGNIPPKMADAVKAAVKAGVAIILVSRCYKGRVLDSYGYEGGGKDLKESGVIFCDRLPGQKARIKLMVALGKTDNMDEIRDIFEKNSYK